MDRHVLPQQEAQHASDNWLIRLENRVLIQDVANYKIQNMRQRIDQLERKLSEVKRSYTDGEQD